MRCGKIAGNRKHSQVLTESGESHSLNVAEAKLPTPGRFPDGGFEELATGQDHVALVYGDISGQSPVLARVHSECLTGDALFSLRCDCGWKRLCRISLKKVGDPAVSPPEGRNIGLLNKIRAYAL